MRTPRFHLRTILIAIALFTVFLHYVAIPTWNYYGLPPKTRAILAKLEEPMSVSTANDTELTVVLKEIRSATQGPNDNGIPIYVDPVGLNEAEKTMTSPVKLDLEGVPIKDVFQQTLEQLGLGYFVEDGLLTITSEKAADQALRNKPKSARRP